MSPSAIAEVADVREVEFGRIDPERGMGAIDQHAAGAADRRRTVARAGSIGGADIERHARDGERRTTIRARHTQEAWRGRERRGTGHHDLLDAVCQIGMKSAKPWHFHTGIRLDDELPCMRDMVEAARRRLNLLASRRYARLARRLHTLVAEVSELTERVDNAPRVTEDVYLARVCGAAMELFRVPNVSAAVDRKLAIIRETYTALHSEAAGARADLLEIAILVLIAVEIILSLIRHG